MGLLTCDQAITEDIVDLFHYLTGRSQKTDYQKLLVAPVNMKDRFLALIAREMDHAKNGRPAHIIAKMNSLEDAEIIRALYKASQAGIGIDLIVRGFCTLRPGVPGPQRQHPRHFHHRALPGTFAHFPFLQRQRRPAGGRFLHRLGRLDVSQPASARGSDRPHRSVALRERLWEILQIMLTDRRQAWELHADGSYQRAPTAKASWEPTKFS